MAKVVNLRVRRKNLERAQRQASAVFARTKFGRTREERALEASEAEFATRTLDGHKLGD